MVVVANNKRTICRNEYQIPEADVAQALKNIWGPGAMFDMITTSINVYFTRVAFSPGGRRSFPTKYRMDAAISLLLKYASDCKICHGHNHMLLRCPFKSICPLWNISQEKENSRIRRGMEPISTTGLNIVNE